MYKQASKLKLRFTTENGQLTVEQLWSLTLPALDKLVVKLDKENNESGVKSYITTKTTENKLAKLRFDIALDVLNSKVASADIATKAMETKARNQKIISLIEEKKEGALAAKSIEELTALLSQDQLLVEEEGY